MGRSESGTDAYSGGDYGIWNEVPEHNATLASFALDKYEVTVGRFRNFVNAYDAWRTAGDPKDNAGVHPIAVNTGWGKSWAPDPANLPATADALKAALNQSTYCTWTAAAGTVEAESYPMNCISWYMAFAFCIWDGGRLPTEAEWEYAAAGGAQNRLYPWGNEAPDDNRANYYGSTPKGSPFIPVGSRLANGANGGAGYFNHADLAGSMFEWVFDWYKEEYYGTTGAAVSCDNCANATSDSYRVIRGGSWDEGRLRAAYRGTVIPAGSGRDIGFRCARRPE